MLPEEKLPKSGDSVTRDWSSLQEKKLAARAMKNAMKEDHLAKKEASVVVMTREVRENLSVVKPIARQNVMKKEASVVVMTRETIRNHSVAIPIVHQNVMKRNLSEESLSAIKNLSVVKPIVRQNAMKKENMVAAADTAERKTQSSTVHRQQARSASTNTSPTQASAHVVKPTTSSSQAL